MAAHDGEAHTSDTARNSEFWLRIDPSQNVPRRTFIGFFRARSSSHYLCHRAAALSHATGDHMRTITFYILITVTCAALPTPTQSLEDSHLSGRRVAMEICSHCHRVAEGQRAPLPNTPSFIDIANMPSTTALSLRAFLQSSRHMTRMPNFIISRSDANAVIGYILSLKQQ
jgi:mono/diheme cytochrome c family protein